MKNFVKGSLSLGVSRITAGLNVNCCKYLIPLWLTPIYFVGLRLLFGTLFFWLLFIFDKPDTSTCKEKIKLLLLGAFMVFGYMSLSAIAISYTTPMNFAIFNATQPMWVFLFSIVLRNEKVTIAKVLGILIGFSGVVATVFSESSQALARNPMIGNLIALLGAVVYAIYLLLSSALLRRVSNLTMLRYTFLGALFSTSISCLFTENSLPLLFWQPSLKPLLVIAFVLIFPTAINYLLISIGVKYLKATLVSMYGYITLLVATLVSLFTGQDKLDIMLVLSMLLICIGIFMVGIAEKS